MIVILQFIFCSLIMLICSNTSDSNEPLLTPPLRNKKNITAN